MIDYYIYIPTTLTSPNKVLTTIHPIPPSLADR